MGVSTKILGESSSKKKKLLSVLKSELTGSSVVWPERGSTDELLVGVGDGTYPMEPVGGEATGDEKSSKDGDSDSDNGGVTAPPRGSGRRKDRDMEELRALVFSMGKSQKN